MSARNKNYLARMSARNKNYLAILSRAFVWDVWQLTLRIASVDWGGFLWGVRLSAA